MNMYKLHIKKAIIKKELAIFLYLIKLNIDTILGIRKNNFMKVKKLEVML